MSEADKVELRKTIQPAAKKISKLHDEKDKIMKRNKSSKAMIEASKGRKQFRSGGGADLGMQSVKYGLDNNPNITKADPKAKFIAKNKNKKNMKKVAKTPMAKAVRKS
jgi:oligoribonuclease NrnB/cAMP/cGMP phosphodiesterase (DHH superfamily)